MAKLRIAGIGAGYFSRFHLEGWRDIADVEIVAWCDLDRAKAEALAREFGVRRTYVDATAMLDALAPDVVDIVTSPPAHAGTRRRTRAPAGASRTRTCTSPPSG